MTKSILTLILAIFLVACTGKTKNQETENNVQIEASSTIDVSTTMVYYFHGKQRCKTCIAVGDLAKKTIENAYAGNDKVRFVEVNTSEKEYADLVEKYEISWNALIIAKGDQFTDLTEQAFATVVNSPEILENLIKETVNKNI